jgi:prophage maintenance system killer protein
LQCFSFPLLFSVRYISNRNLCIIAEQNIEYQMENLTIEQGMAIHAGIGAASDTRLVSEAGLHQMVFQANLLTDPFRRAAFVIFSLVAYPVFREENKQTAFAVADLVLAAKGYRLTAELVRIQAIIDGIETYSMEPEDIEEWISRNVRKNGISAP